MKKLLIVVLFMSMIVGVLSAQTRSAERPLVRDEANQRIRVGGQSTFTAPETRNRSVFWSENFDTWDDIPASWDTSMWVLIDYDWGIDDTQCLTADVYGYFEEIEVAWITPPAIGPLPANAKLEFFYNLWEWTGEEGFFDLATDITGLTIEIRVNGTTVHTINNANYPGPDWNGVIVDLSAFEGQTVNITWFAEEEGLWPYIWDTDNLSIFSEGGSDSDIVYIGNPNSTVFDTEIPFNYYYYTSLAQTIYLDSEMTTSGTITHVTFRVNNSAFIAPDGAIVRMYMLSGAGIPDTFAMGTDWLPYGQFVRVFEGELPLANSGIYDVTIPLDTEYQYVSGNLVLMFHKLMFQEEFDIEWQETSAGIGVNRTIYARNDSTDYNPMVIYPNGNTYNMRANVTFHFGGQSDDVYDIATTTFVGPTAVNVNVPNTWNLTIANNGTVTATGYTVRLMQVGTPPTVLQAVAGTPIEPNTTILYTMIGTFPNTGEYEVYGEVIWTPDTNETNNTTASRPVNVFPAGMLEVYLGNPDSATTTGDYPIDYWYWSSLTQSIYLGEEIGSGGLITHITYRMTSNDSDVPEIPVQIWLYNTTQVAFANNNAWVIIEEGTPPNYEGIVLPSPNQEGTFYITIELDEPFAYNGDNLVITSRKVFTSHQGSGKQWHSTNTPGRQSSIRHRTDISTIEYNVSNPPTAGQTSSLIPNVSLTMITGGMGTITGTVTQGGEPVPDALVTIVELGRQRYTDTNGQYILGFVPVGTYSLTAEKFGYVTTTNSNVVVTENQTTTSNFALNLASAVTISGVVIASDTNAPLADAKVMISGSPTFYEPIYTPANGTFSFPDITTFYTYTLSVEIEGYSIHTQHVVVEAVDVNVGNVMVFEIPYPPTNLVAAVEAGAVSLTWTPPAPPSSRALENYAIYRAVSGEHMNPDNWVTIGTSTTASYTDNTWSNLNGGTFIYIVVAVYTNDNASTPIYSNGVMHLPANQVYLGNPGSTQFGNLVPIDMNYRNTVSQTIYYESELTLGGMISHITYNFRGGDVDAPKEFQFYMATIPADKMTFTGSTDWIPGDQFTQVFNGFLNVEDSGERLLEIELDPPFIYTGGNLVIATTRTYTPNETWWNGCAWQATDIGQTRNIYRRVDGEQLNIFTPGAGTLSNTTPNVLLTFDLSGMGNLTGTVTSGTPPQPLANVTVSIDGTSRSTTTNAAGVYYFDYVPAGVITITGERLGYGTYNSPDITITADETTTHNFSIESSLTVTVTGTVRASDTVLPVAGASVSLSGFASFGPVTSATDGTFTIPGVFGYQDYIITASAPGYNTSNNPLSILGEDTNIGDVFVLETTWPARNVVAELEDGNAKIVWDPPAPPPTGNMFSHSTIDAYDNALGVQGGGAIDFDFIPVQRFTEAQLTQLGVAGNNLTHIGLWANNTGSVFGQATFDLVVYTGGSASPLSPGQEVYRQAVDPELISWNEYSYIELDTPFAIPTTGEMWIGYQAYVIQGYVASMDPGPGIANFGDVFYWGGGTTVGWMSAVANQFNANWMIKGIASTSTGREIVMGHMSYTLEEQLGIGVTYDIPSHKEGDTHNRFALAGEGSYIAPSFAARRDNNIPALRAHTGYNLYRANELTIADPDTWTLLQANIPLTTNSYTDNTFNTLPDWSQVRYVVVAVYTNNNFANPAISNALVKGAGFYIYMGDPNSTTWNSLIPVNMNWRNTISQTIYYEDDITAAGLITHITYNYQGGNVDAPKEFQFYLATIDASKTVFDSTTDWIPASEFTQVFNGMLPVQAGNRLVTVTLDEPFVYDGGNLVVMTTRTFTSGETWWVGTNWHVTASGANRSLARSHDTEQLSPENYGTGGYNTNVPNIYLTFNTDGLGHLAGTVTGGTPAVPLQNALITIEGSPRTARTNAQGEYIIEYLDPGSYNVTAELFGYVVQTNNNVVIIADQTTTSNFVLPAAAAVTVSGTVIGSDTNQPIEEAMINLYGEANYGPVATATNGTFSIPNVISSATYTIEVVKAGYQTYIEELIIGLEAVNLDIMIFERAFPARNVTAAIDNNAVIVNWVEPFVPDPNAIEISHLVTEEPNPYSWGGPHHWQTIARFTPAQLANIGAAGAMLTEVQVYLTPGNVVDFAIQVFTGGSGAPLSPGTLAHTQAIPVGQLVDNDWNIFALTTPVAIPTNDELWFGYVSTGLTDHFKFTVIDAPGSQTGFGDVMNINNEGWTTIQNYEGYEEMWMIKGTASAASGQRINISNLPEDVENAVQKTFNTSSKENDPMLNGRRSSQPNILTAEQIQQRQVLRGATSRAHTGYNVYRTLTANVNNPELWTTLQANLPITTLSYTDNTWIDAENWGAFRYIVVAVYTNNNHAAPALSNPLTKMPTNISYLGDEFSNVATYEFPINYFYQRSISQTIYPAEEFTMGGLITHLTWRFTGFGDILPPIPVQVYVGTTTQTSYPNGDASSWVPIEGDHVLVYNAPLTVSTAGTYFVTIEFDEPFAFGGGNLAVTVVKNWNAYYNSGNVFQATETADARTIARRYDSGADFDPYNPPTGSSAFLGMTNTIFTFDTAGMGHVAGTVMGESPSVPLQNAIVRLDGTPRTARTNAQGEYIMQYVPQGSQSFTAELFGYVSQTLPNVTIVENETTTANFILPSAPNVSVSGTVIASDTDQPMLGAVVNVTGPANYGPITTGTNGIFMIPEVVASTTYQLTIEKEGYITYSEPLVVGVTDLNLGNVMLYEIAYPARNVVAELEDGNMKISWDPPYIPVAGEWFSHVQSNPFANHIGVNNPATLQKGHRYTQDQLEQLGIVGAQIFEVEFVPRNIASITSNRLRIFTGGSASPLDPGTEVHTQIVEDALIDNEWNLIVLSQPFTIPSTGELWIVIEYVVSGSVPMGADDGPVIDGFGNIVHHPEWGWSTLTEQAATLTYNWSIRAKAATTRGVVNVSPIRYSLEEQYGRNYTTTMSLYGAKEEDLPKFVKGETFDFAQRNIDTNNRLSRAHTGYNIYRTVSETATNPDTWTFLQSLPVTQTAYTDFDWANVPDYSNYRFVVVAVFTNDNFAPPALSNSIPKLPESMIYIGDPASTLMQSFAPVDMNYRQTISQTIYFHDEIPSGGLITDLVYYYQGGNVDAPKEFQFYMAVVPDTKTSFASGTDWIPADQFIQVFNGFIPVQAGPDRYIFIELDEPFVYAGGNLVIMTTRTYTAGETYWQGTGWHATNNIGSNRSIHQRQDSYQFIPGEWGTGSLSANVPNIMLNFNSEGLGTITGTVTTTIPAGPVANAIIRLDGTNYRTTSGADGVYNMQYVIPGTYDMTITRELYLDQHYTNITVGEDQVVTQNVTLLPYLNDLAAISLTGNGYPTAGEDYEYVVTIRNVSADVINASAYNIRLRQVIDGGDDFQLATVPGQTITAGEVRQIIVPWTPASVSAPTPMIIYAYVDFPADVDMSDNTTDVMNITVQPAGTAVVYWGNPNSTTMVTTMPFEYYYRRGLAQSIYTSDMLNIGGELNGIVYEYFGGSSLPETGILHTMWIAEVDKQSFANTSDWVPFENFTLVFEGTLPTDVPGPQDILIPFETSIIYGGGDLVVMTQRHDSGWANGNTWRNTASGAPTTLWYRSDTTTPDPGAPPAGVVESFNPNASFIFNTMGFGHMTGTITNNDTPSNPVAGAEVRLSGTNRRTFSNSEGVYTFMYAPEGSQSFDFSRHGYITQYITETIIDQQTITKSVVLERLPNVPVTGRVVRSDLNIGFEGATVTLTGYEDYETTSDANGNFEFANVYSSFTYTLTIKAAGFKTFVDDTVEIGTVPVDLGDINIDENTPRPRNVQAVVAGSNAIITWEEPGYGEDVWFSHSNGISNPDWAMGLTAGGWYETAHRYTADHLAAFGVQGAELTHLEFHPYPGPTEVRVRVYVGGSGGTVGTRVIDQLVTNVVYEDWNLVELNTPVEIPENGELWYSFYTVHPAGTYPHGNDTGPAVAGFGNLRAFEGTAFSPQGSSSSNWLIRGMASNVIGTRYFGHGLKEAVVLNSPYSRSSANDLERGFATPGNTAPEGVEALRGASSVHNGRFTEATYIPPQSIARSREQQTVRNNSRILEGYRVLRSTKANIDIPGNWIQLTQFTTDLMYTDTSFSGLQDNDYIYIVRAVYTSADPENPNMSDPSFSNEVNKGTIANITVNISTPDGDATGAVVRFVGDYQYEATVVSGNSVELQLVRFGAYSITITLANHLQYHNDYFYVWAQEITYNATMYHSFALVEEGFDGTAFPPTGWTRWTDITGANIDLRQWHRTNEAYNDIPPIGAGMAASRSWYNNIGFEPNNYLITPELEIPAGLAVSLTYMVRPEVDTGPNPEWGADKYSIYVSTTGNAIEDFTAEIFTQTFPIPYNFPSPFWQPIEVDLSPYAGMTIHLAFRHWDCFDHSAVLLDEVKLLASDAPLPKPENFAGVQLPESQDVHLTWNAPQGPAPLGYRLSHNYVTLPQLITTTESAFYDLLPGVNVFTLAAVYPEGESQIVTTVVDVIPYILVFPPVSNVEAVAHDGYATITWDAPIIPMATTRNTNNNSGQEVNVRGAFEAAQRGRNSSQVIESAIRRTEQNQARNANANSMVLFGYMLYFSTEANQYNQDNWEVAGFTEDLYYDDDYLWPDVEPGKYYYHVVAVYASPVGTADPVSAFVEKYIDDYGDVHIYFTTNGVTPTTGVITLTGSFGNHETTYPASGPAIFTNVQFALYTLTVNLVGFQTYVNNNFSHGADPTEYTANVIPIIPAPTNVVAAIEAANVKITWTAPAPLAFAEEPAGHTISTDNRSSARNTTNSGVRSRQTYTYNVYRSTAANVGNPPQWVTIASGIAATEYIDTAWTAQPVGTYFYFVRTVFNSILSDATQSNEVVKLPPTATVNITLNTGEDSPVGAVVKLGTHQITATSSTVTFNDIPYDTYELNITLDKFMPYDASINVNAPVVSHTADMVKVGIEVELVPPDFTVLKGNYPNPFNPATTIHYEIAVEGMVKIDIYNIRGQLVKTLVDSRHNVGRYTAEWNGTDDYGRNVTSGVYLYHMKTEDFNDMRRMVLMK